MSARLKEEFNNRIRKELLTEKGFKNLMEVPTLTKIVVNAGVGEATTNKGALDEMSGIFEQITGQKPVLTKAKKAVSAFKVREGMEVGIMVTLRGDRMWEFMDKLVNVVLPRTKEFRGLNPNAFDGAGNYALGIKEHTVFPEIDTNKVQKIRPLQIIFVTTAKNNDAARAFLDKFGFPFKK